MVLVKPGEEQMLTSMGFLSQCRQMFVTPPHSTSFKQALTQAESGDAEAQFGLGLKYSAEGEATQDLARAAGWYRRAAEQGHALAQFNLGVMLASGQGVPQDEAAALTWNQRAAEGGDPAAQFALGSRCHRHSAENPSTDGGESRVEAFKWFQLAADQGYLGSEAACQRLTLDMSRDEVAMGSRRAAAFLPRKPIDRPGNSTSVIQE
jgi:hypothetical protein